jgi:hypothetical protein
MGTVNGIPVELDVTAADGRIGTILRSMSIDSLRLFEADHLYDNPFETK